MANDSILIVDDTPVNLKLVRVLLSRQGFNVRTASTAEEALEIFPGFRPRLVLADIQLPGMDGLELTRRLKSDPATRDTVVLALTAFAMKGDEEKAFEAGCDGYITKPIDTRTFPTLIRQYLNRSGENQGTSLQAAAEGPALEDENLAELRRTFLAEGMQQAGRLMNALSTGQDCAEAQRISHRWAGTAGSIGFPEISARAREMETVLSENGPGSTVRGREVLVRLARLFADNLEQQYRIREHSGPQQAAQNGKPAPSPAVLATLTGKRFALTGFDQDECERLSRTLERYQAFSRDLGAELPDEDALRPFDMVILNVLPSLKNIPEWSQPVLLVGTRDILLRFQQPVQGGAQDFLFSPWSDEEVALRACFALARKGENGSSRQVHQRVKPRVLIADDDSTIRALVEATVQNSGLECRVVGNGTEALETVREWHPDAAVLDVNMPSLNGFEVLSSLRQDPLTRDIRVILLTARQQETDVIRGFGLGADDYVIKPFSPMELIARLKRLIGTTP
jgi:two-component system cell cycle response regulator DivK